jgi:hypothetical protein
MMWPSLSMMAEKTSGLVMLPRDDFLQQPVPAPPDLDSIQLNRIKVWILRLRMIFSENRFPLFETML